LQAPLSRPALRYASEEAGVTGVPLVVIGGQTLTGLQGAAPLAAVTDN